MSDANEIARRYTETHTRLGQLYLQRVEAVNALKALDKEIEKAHKDVLHQLRSYEGGSND